MAKQEGGVRLQRDTRIVLAVVAIGSALLVVSTQHRALANADPQFRGAAVHTRHGLTLSRADVTVVMSDTRSLFAPRAAETQGSSSTPYYQLTAAINLQYARRHGYKFRWYQPLCVTHGGPMSTCGAVRGPKHQWRSPQWAKLLAINHTLANTDTEYIFFLDSDSFVSEQQLRVPALLGSAVFGAWADEIPGRVCTGPQVWRRSPDATRLLLAWWHVDTPGFDRSRNFEQTAFNKHLFTRDDLTRSMEVWPSRGFGSNGTYWDSGLVVPWSLGLFDLRHEYRTYVQHMWGGLAKKHIAHIRREFTRTTRRKVSTDGTAFDMPYVAPTEAAFTAKRKI